MATIACRWPGGTNLIIKRQGQVPLICPLAGPPGEPMTTPPMGRGVPTRAWATSTQTAVMNTVDRMMRTAEHPLDDMVYVTNEVADNHWHAWLEQNKDFDLVKHKIVFELPKPVVVEQEI